MSNQQFFLRGTKCKSCEVVIERELVAQDGIEAAEVSHARRTLRIKTDGDRRFKPEELTEMLARHGYQVGKKDKGPKRTRIDWKKVGGAAVIVLAVYLLLEWSGILRFSPSAENPAGLLGVLAIGLVASVSSCTAVVGGLVAAVAGKMAKEQRFDSRWHRFKPHLLFNVGRIGGFVLLGALIGSVGSAIQLSPTLNGLFVILVAALMVVIGVNLLEVFPAPVVSMPKRLAHKVHDLAESDKPLAPLVLGAMTFFLPCGFTQSMQLFALTLGSPLQAGLVMGVFALGTAPVLLGIGGVAATASGKTLGRLTRAAGVVVLALGISNALNGLALMGFSPSSIFAKAEPASALTIVGGKQFIQMEVSELGIYLPDVLTVQEDIPVEWSIHGAEFMGCANSLILPAFGVNAYLRPGINTVEFTPTKPGNYTFSCSMGMVRGTMVVTSAN